MAYKRLLRRYRDPLLVNLKEFVDCKGIGKPGKPARRIAQVARGDG